MQEPLVAIAKRAHAILPPSIPVPVRTKSGRSFSGHRPRRRRRLCHRLCSTHLSVSQCGSGNETKILYQLNNFEFEETGARKDRGERRK